MHYTLPPVVGGVEAVIHAHVELLARHGYPLTLIAGRGGGAADFPGAARTLILPELDTRHPRVLALNADLEQGRVPQDFSRLSGEIAAELRPLLSPLKWVIVHNVFTKHFNLAFTAALFNLLDEGVLPGGIAWCHDFTWTSPHSRSKVFPGYPWDLLRTPHPSLSYVAISKQRRAELAGMFSYPEEEIRVIYNGVNPASLLGLSPQGLALSARLGLMHSDLILLMPVRVTQAKDLEYALQVTAALKGLGLRPRLVVTGPPDPHDADNQAYFASLLKLRAQLGVEEEARFVVESGPTPGNPFTIDESLVGELYRLADLVFLPSHREGFGMPLVEAGFVGAPVVSTGIPAASEIGGEDILRIEPGQTPEDLAGVLFAWAAGSQTHRLRRRVRQDLTWEAIFTHAMQPLLDEVIR